MTPRLKCCCSPSGNTPEDVDSNKLCEGGTCVQDEFGQAEVVDASTEVCQTCSRRWRPIPMTLLFSVIVVAFYAAYGRLGTTANADSVEYTRNLTGGFLAVGMTNDQPGFIVLSALDRKKVEVSTVQNINPVAGAHTVVEVVTPTATTRSRLRGPLVILISENGAIEKHAVRWTVDEFNELRSAADCSHEAAAKKHRCGKPFTDLQEAFTKWTGQRVPDEVRAFVEPFKDRRTHKHNDD